MVNFRSHNCMWTLKGKILVIIKSVKCGALFDKAEFSNVFIPKVTLSFYIYKTRVNVSQACLNTFYALYPSWTGHIMRSLSHLNSQRMCILCQVCKGYKTLNVDIVTRPFSIRNIKRVIYPYRLGAECALYAQSVKGNSVTRLANLIWQPAHS